MAYSFKNGISHPPAFRALVLLFALILPTLTAGAGPVQKPRFAVSNLTLKDTATGLVWVRNGNPAGQMLSWHDAVRFVHMLNQKNYAGHSDWRLPEIDELKKLVSAAREIRANGTDKDSTLVAALTRAGFDVQAGDYWSSTTSLFNNSEALYINMVSGSDQIGSKSLYMHVWPVRTDGKKKQGVRMAPGSPSSYSTGT
jgi:hypothetical protein